MSSEFSKPGSSAENITLPPLSPDEIEFYLSTDALLVLLEGDSSLCYLRLRSDILEMYPEGEKEQEVDEIAPRNYRMSLPSNKSEEEITESPGMKLLEEAHEAFESVWEEQDEDEDEDTPVPWWWIINVQRKEPEGNVIKVPFRLDPSPLAHQSDGVGLWWISGLRPAPDYENGVMEKIAQLEDPDEVDLGVGPFDGDLPSFLAVPEEYEYQYWKDSD